MSAMANTTPIVTTITKIATKEKTPSGAKDASRVNMLAFCEEHCEDIFDTYSPSTTKSGLDSEYTKDGSYSRGRPHKRDSSPGRDRSHDIEESCGNTYPSYRTWEKHRYHSHGTWRSSSMKRGKNSESPLSRVSESGTSERAHWKSKSKRRMPTNEEDLAAPWLCEEVECWTMPTWCHMFNSTVIGTARIWFDELPMESVDGYKDLKAAFLAYFMQQNKYVKDLVEIHNIKQQDEETIDDFMERFKRVKRQKVTQSFTHVKDITFLPLAANKGTGGPLVIEAKISEHAVHHIYVDGGSSMEVLYEHYFNQLWPEIKSQMVPATTSLTCFSGETIWPLGQLRILVTIWDAKHYTRAWMNFMIVRSPSPYNGIIGRHEIRKIQAVPSTAHGVLKFLVNGGIVTIRSTILMLTECTTIAATPKDQAKKAKARHKNYKVVINPGFLDQEITIGGTISIKSRTKLEGYSPVRQKTRAGPGARQCNQSRGTKTGGGRNFARSILPRLVIQPSHGEEARQQLEDMAEQDEEKTAFHTSHGVYCYTKMPFGFKNAGATYQRSVEKAFDKQIDKTEVVLQLPSPRTIKEVQSLNEKLASLNRFISKSAEKSLPLFKTLKKCIKKSDFYWTPDEEQAFKQLKQHLAKLPMLLVPKPKEELIMYLSASYEAISVGLMTERDNRKGHSSDFVSRALQAPKLNYSPMEKLVLALVCAAKSLHRYLQAHPIVVFIDQPIKQVMSRHILVYFLIEKPDDTPLEASMIKTPHVLWTLFMDGSSSFDGSGAGMILTSPEGTEFTYALRFQFIASNNEAEYEALIASLRIASQMGVRNVHVSVDSKLVANQVLGTYIAKDENMVNYLEKAKSLINGFANFSITQVPRSKNKKADALSKIASTSFAHLSKQVLVEDDEEHVYNGVVSSCYHLHELDFECFLE
nr:reverse transcriptase domain-containing protein [Tanacetum cinerariifolium]